MRHAAAVVYSSGATKLIGGYATAWSGDRALGKWNRTARSSARRMAGKQTKPVMGIENFVRGAHKRDEYEMPNNFRILMTDFREILVY